MINLPPSFSQNLVLFMLISVGFAAGKLGVLKQDTTRALSRFLVDFILPALIIMSMQQPFSPELRNLALRILGISALIYLLSFPLAYGITALYPKTEAKEMGVHRFVMCFSNIAFIGFPVAEAVLGKESLFAMSIYSIPFQLLTFSVGIILIAGPEASHAAALGAGKSIKARSLAILKMLNNPPIISACLGFIFFLTSVKIPKPISTAMEITGSMMTPMAMMIIGAILAQTKVKKAAKNPRLWLTSTYRLAVFPILVYVGGSLLGLKGLELSVPVLVGAMPAAANSTLLSSVYGGDEATASGLVFITTAISMISIPLISRLIS